VLQRYKGLGSWLTLFVVVAFASSAPSPVRSHADDPLVLLTTIETGGQPSALVHDDGDGRNDILFYDGDRIRILDGDLLAVAPEQILLPTREWEGWMVYDHSLHRAYVLTTQNRESPMHVIWKEVQVHVVANRSLLDSFSVNQPYNADSLDPADRFYGLDGLALKEPLSEGANAGRLIVDDTANGNIDVVDLDAAGTGAARRQRYSYRDTLCTVSHCSWETRSGNALALEARHETVTPDDLAGNDVLYIADPNRQEQGLPLYGHLRALQLNHPGLDLGATPLPDLDLSGTWPFGNGNHGLALAGPRDILYVASGQQSFDDGYVAEVNTVNGQVKEVIELTYADEGFVHVDWRDPRRAFVATFDGWYNDEYQALWLHLLYDGTVVHTLRLLDNYDIYNGLRDMVYDPLHQRLYLAVGNGIMVVQVNHGVACPSGLAGVQIAGPTFGQLGFSYPFRASVTPSDATPPVTYTWSPPPLSGQGTPTATYLWTTPGQHTIGLEAGNCGGGSTDVHDITIWAEALPRIYLPAVTCRSP
jgi:hypothetical protein